MVRSVRVHDHLRVTEALDTVELRSDDVLDVLWEKLLDHLPKLFLFIDYLILFLIPLLDLKLHLCHFHSLLVFISLELLSTVRLHLLLII